MSEHLPTSTTESTPVASIDENEQYRLVLIDQTHDARDQARDLADLQLTEELNQGNAVSRFVKGVWKGNLLKDYYRVKYTQKYEAQIQANNDVLQAESLSGERTKAISSLVTRFQDGEEEMIHTEAGERRQEHAADDALGNGLKDIIRRFAVEKSLNETTLQEEKKRLLEAYGKENPDADLSKSLVLTDNLLEIAQSIKGRFEHDDGMTAAIDNMQIITGAARNGARTEAHYTNVDKLVDKLSKTRIGSLVTPGALATGTALALSIAGVGVKSVAGAAAVTAGLGTVAGVWAGIRENKRVKDERTQHAREMAVGGHVDHGDKRREQMEKTRYEAVSALDMIGELHSRTSDEALAKTDETEQSEALTAALEALARAQARIDLSDSEKIDLIQYSSKADVGEERMMLDLARIESRKKLAEALTPEMRAKLGIEAELNVKDIIAARAEAFTSELESDISDKDKAFRALKARRVAFAAATGTIVGIAGGLVSQEIIAGIDPSRLGVFEAFSGAPAPIGANGEVHQTILAGFVNGESTTEHIDASSVYEQHATTGESFVKVGDDQEWVQNEDGTHTIIGPDGKPSVEGIVINEDGSMDQASIDQIKAAGLAIEDKTWTTGGQETVTQSVSVEEYWQKHTGEMQNTSIDKWFTNNTNQPDGNELRMYRGGDNGIIEGGYRFEAGGMTPNGSSLNGEYVNPIEAAQAGNLVMVISKVGEDSGPMFTIQSDAGGGFNIMSDNPASALFVNENGQAQLADGFRASVYVNQGVDANGVMHGGSLATMMGEAEVGSITETQVVNTEVTHYGYTITSAGQEIVHENVTEIAPITPIVPRRPLEVLKAYRAGGERAPGSAGSSYYGYGENYEAKAKRWREERSPRLKKNPDADLNTGDELDWYRNEQVRRRGEAYVDEIDRNVEQSEVLKAVDDTTEAIVCIPVAAASESENIYRTLSMFARQDDQEAINKTVVLLNLNWKEELTKDPEQLEKIRKTIAEVQRAQADFPDLKIASFNKVWTEDFVQEKQGKIYGEVIKVLYDTAAFALDRAVKAGVRNKDTEAILITNDADTEGMSRSYVKRYLDTFEKNPKQDAFTGLIRRGTESYKEYPGYGVVSAFYAMMTQAMLHTQPLTGGGSTTDGPNSGVRMSMYAAMGGVDESDGAGADAMLSSRMITVRRAEGERTLIDRLRRAPVPEGSNRVIGKYVSGAAIDTVPDRLLGAYREGKFIADGWNNFDSGGYEDRSVSLAKGVVEPENVERDIDDIAERVEKSLNGFGSFWWKDNPAAMALAMNWTFGVNRDDIREEKRTPEDKNLYEYKWDHSKEGAGRFTFKFTEDGKKWLKTRLLKDAQGRSDPYGQRLRRQLYNEVAKRSKKRPVQSTPRMLA